MGAKVPLVKQVETLNYRPGGFHPVHLQDKFKSDRYTVIHKLGHGGFATVWLARDAVRERYVALKILAARLSEDCPEVEILRKLRNGADLKGKAYVMSMLDHFWIEGPNGRHLCIVSEVAGPSIKQFNSCPGQCSGSRRLRASIGRKVALQATEGLAYIHSTGTVHGDFTSANILLQLSNIDAWSETEIIERLGNPQITTLHRLVRTEKHSSSPRYTVNAIQMKDVDPQWLSDTIFIIDFGIAFLQEQSSVDIGTPKSYCAPELFFHSPRSISSDIWALGCTIFEIRTGSQLFSFKGRPSRTQRLMAMVKMLGKMPDEWFADWDEGAEWYTAQVEKGGELADIIKGTLYTEIMDVGVHDADYRQIFTPYIDEQAGRSSEDVSRTSTLSRMIAIVGDLTTSEVDYVLEEANKSDEKPGGSGSGNSGDSNKATSGSSNSKSGEKSTSSEGISTGTKPDTAKESTGDRADILSLRGEDSLSRMPLASVKELPEPSAVRDFLEQSGMKVTAIEGEGLDELLRMALTFLPGDRIGPKELSKHHWFVDNFED